MSSTALRRGVKPLPIARICLEDAVKLAMLAHHFLRWFPRVPANRLDNLCFAFLGETRFDVGAVVTIELARWFQRGDLEFVADVAQLLDCLAVKFAVHRVCLSCIFDLRTV